MVLRLLTSIFFIVLFNLAVFSQSDSVICPLNCELKEGVYISWSDFRMRNALQKDLIISDQDKSAIDFYSKVLNEDKLTYSTSGSKNVIETKNIWGFCQNNVLHLNYEGHFYRVPLFGSISYLIANVEVITPAYYTPGYGMYGSGKTTEIHNFLMNFYDGRMKEFNMEEAELLLSRDKELYAEYNALKRKKKKEQISRYIRKFNERNPIYFLK